MAEVVNRINALGFKHNLEIGTFGHAGDGNLHPTIVLDKEDKAAIARADEALKDIFALALEFNGTITGEHGVGSAKLPYLRDQIGDVGMQVHRNLKKVFDPNGILNPNRLGS
jgi:glycolate oxidase